MQKIISALLFVTVVVVVGSLVGLVWALNVDINNAGRYAATTELRSDRLWHVVDAEKFIVSLPQGWRYVPRQGIDSFVGEFSGEGVTLLFDYGAYSNPLPEENDPDHVVVFKTVGGKNAKVVVPKSGVNGTTGIYFADVLGDGTTKLNVYGESIAADKQGIVLEIVHSVQFPAER